MKMMNNWGICGMTEQGTATGFQEFFLIQSEYLENLLRLVGPAVNKKKIYKLQNVRVTERLAIELDSLQLGNHTTA
jgi:hypothetical protein